MFCTYILFFYAAKIYGVPTEEQRKFIAQKVKSKWHQIGIHLRMNQAEIDQIIHECSHDDSRCSSVLFRKWAAQELSTPYPFTWEGIIAVLDNFVIKESSLARQLESKYM